MNISTETLEACKQVPSFNAKDLIARFGEQQLIAFLFVIQQSTEGMSAEVKQALEVLSPELRSATLEMLKKIHRNYGSVIFAIEHPERLN
jgi:hypothetical protein